MHSTCNSTRQPPGFRRLFTGYKLPFSTDQNKKGKSGGRLRFLKKDAILGALVKIYFLRGGSSYVCSPRTARKESREYLRDRCGECRWDGPPNAPGSASHIWY